MKGEHLGEFEEFTLLAVRALGDHTYAVPIQQYVAKIKKWEPTSPKVGAQAPTTRRRMNRDSARASNFERKKFDSRIRS